MYKVMIIIIFLGMLSSEVFGGKVTLTLPQNQQFMFRQIVIKCLRETKATLYAAQKLRVGDFSIRDDKTKCFTKCIALNRGYFNEAGDIFEEPIRAYLAIAQPDSEKVESIIKTCTTPLGEKNLCDYSFEAFECFWSEMRKYESRIAQLDIDFGFLESEADELFKMLEDDKSKNFNFDNEFQKKNITLNAILKRFD